MIADNDSLPDSLDSAIPTHAATDTSMFFELSIDGKAWVDIVFDLQLDIGVHAHTSYRPGANSS